MRHTAEAVTRIEPGVRPRPEPAEVTQCPLTSACAADRYGRAELPLSPPELGAGGLTDSINWQIDPNGALVKRTGFFAWSAACPGGAILELMVLSTSGGTVYFLAHTADGHVYSTTDGIVWTSIDSGLSTSTAVGWCQYLDKIYWCDGAANFRQWDGTTLTTFAGMPKSVIMCIWRNRLFVANGRTVYWSLAGTATDFATYPLNTVVFPDDTLITAMTTIQNVSGADGSDGVLVFSRGRRTGSRRHDM